MKKHLLLLFIVCANTLLALAQNTNAIYGGNQNVPSTNNTFVGYSTGGANTTGTGNTFVGSFVGASNTIGQYNLFAGSAAGNVNTQGGFNVFLGYAAGFGNTIGTGNTFVGSGTGNNFNNSPNAGNLSGFNNTYLGVNAGASGGLGYQLFNATAIGSNAKVSVNNAIVLGDTMNNVKIGIGLTNPKFPLDINGIINMRVAFHNPALKINDRDFLKLDKNGGFSLSNFNLTFESTDEWTDSVFEPETRLMSLAAVSEYIRQNKHLPEIPSALEVVQNGIEINTIIAKMLRKIEELTLYTIQQKNEIEELKTIISKFSVSQATSFNTTK
ncbi:hypothetical protein [Emticicia sp. BO119]|uniref:hypothetical protein n=1 Tax=Emticicia sp. BO119 TaxID=2757768 RepID=UPI0015F0F9CA|nr:hypothetical protein [Emticicia sp. BO119]MBA4850286.1 hypothetical protein [Emticicia sp. BO119]